ncbi:FIMAH domain-containing protein [Paenibacillus arenilitoris]|uniref:FIMAH domain-containing protein n=1 Tax=Paenibacillus arenilitoris TaxID=2772299 RepID=A0A927CLD4_9BACL|nr:hypothetical protein [Paenibacillus arenilitoris]MBD2868718.1 hypothetical protein [Paenibacillus arenilitoris]
MKKHFNYICAALCVALVWSLAGAGTAHARVDRSFGAPSAIGSPIQSIAIYDGTFGKEDGRDVIYTTVSGKPAIFQVIDLASRTVLRTYPLPGSESSWSHLTLPDGTVYIGGGGAGKLFSYSPAAKELKDLGGIGEGVAYGLSHDEKGRVYFGSYPNAKIGRYDPATGEMKDYGTVAPGQSYSRSTAYHDGYVYAGIGIQGSIVKLNVETGEKETIALPTHGGAVDTGMVNQLDAWGGYLVAGLSSAKSPLLFYDLASGEWSDRYHLNNKGIRLSHGKPGSGKAYFAQNNRIMELDLTTLDAVDTGIPYGTFLRGTAWIDFPGDPELPGSSLATVTFGGGVAYLNPETKTAKVIEYPVQGNPIPIQTLENGPDGKLYMSGYPGGRGASYSPETGETVSFPLGQAEGMGYLGDKLYMGVYPGAKIYELDTSKPLDASANPRHLFDVPHQDRPFKMIAGEGKLFIGTIPDYGVLGGSLTVYDPASGEPPAVYEDVVHHQSIVGLALKDGKLYGSTTVAGGLGIDPTEPAAKLFVWDVASGTKEKEWVPQIPGLAAAPKMIGGLSLGPDGLLWAAADGAIFAVDPATQQIVKSKVIYPGVTDYGRWRPIQMRWGADGYLYTTLAGQMTVIDPANLDSVALGAAELMTLGEDGHIYYADSTVLKKIGVAEGTGEIPVKVGLPIRNGSFDEQAEDGSIPGWSSLFNVTPNVSYGLSEERAATAPYALKLTDRSTTETVAVATEPIGVKPGTEYTASAKLFLQEGRTLASFNFYDAAGKQLDSKSLQITQGAGAWQTLEMKGIAPAGAAYARLVLFCSTYWMTTAYYDDASISYTVQATPDRLLASIGDWASEGAIGHSLSKKLENAVKQAVHQLEKGREKQAVKHFEDGLKHLEKTLPNEAAAAARAEIEAQLQAFVAEWSS